MKKIEIEKKLNKLVCKYGEIFEILKNIGHTAMHRILVQLLPKISCQHFATHLLAIQKNDLLLYNSQVQEIYGHEFETYLLQDCNIKKIDVKRKKYIKNV